MHPFLEWQKYGSKQMILNLNGFMEHVGHKTAKIKLVLVLADDGNAKGKAIMTSLALWSF